MSLPTTHHISYFRRALALAQERKGFCAPNPAVGAVVVKENRIIGEGWHPQAGAPHAEVIALQGLSVAETEGASLYVTLEPCAHFGKTPPCTDLLIRHKLASVYYAFQDPHPLVSGKGQQKLEQAGIHCEHIPVDEIQAFYQSYAYWVKTRHPWVSAKIALSLDGKIAGLDGTPVQITGEALQRYTHDCRKQADAILTTAKTILNDNPRLNVRLPQKTYKKPLYVMDSQLTLPTSVRIFTTAYPVTLFHAPDADPAKKASLLGRGVHCVAISARNGRLALTEILDYLGEKGVHDLWVEAGGALFHALHTENLLHRALIYVAPKFLGADALPLFTEKMAFFPHKAEVTWRQYGQDALCDILLGDQ